MTERERNFLQVFSSREYVPPDWNSDASYRLEGRGKPFGCYDPGWVDDGGSLGKALKFAREQAGLTQGDMSQRVGLGIGGLTVETVERGGLILAPKLVDRWLEVCRDQPQRIYWPGGK